MWVKLKKMTDFLFAFYVRSGVRYKTKILYVIAANNNYTQRKENKSLFHLLFQY